jgi:CRISPR-associated endonuclease Cas3-HD
LRNTAQIILNPRDYAKLVRSKLEKLKLDLDVDLLENDIRAVSNRLNMILGINNARRIAAISCCLHDVGKVVKVYQQGFRKCNGGEKRISLAGHELLSAWIAWNTLDTLVNYGEPVRVLVSTAVLLHHVSRRSVHEAYHRLRLRLGSLEDDDLKSLVDVTFKACNHLINIDQKRLLSSIIYQVRLPNPLLKTISEIAGRRESKYGELLAYLISVADNIDSLIFRKDKTYVSFVKRYIYTS